MGDSLWCNWWGLYSSICYRWGNLCILFIDASGSTHALAGYDGSSNFGTGLYASVVHAFYGLDLAYAHTNVGPHLNSVHDRWLMVGVQGASQFK